MGINLSLVMIFILVVGVLPWLIWRIWQTLSFNKKNSRLSFSAEPLSNISTASQKTSLSQGIFENHLNLLPETSTFSQNFPHQQDLLAKHEEEKIKIIPRGRSAFMGYELWQALQNNGFRLNQENQFVWKNTSEGLLFYLTFFPVPVTLDYEQVGSWYAKALFISVQAALLHHPLLQQVVEHLVEDLSGAIQEK